MIKTTALFALAATAMPALAGGTVSQTASFDWDGLGDWDIASFDAFDDAGGTRQLTGVNYTLTADTRWDVTAYNYSPTPFGPDDWFADGFINFNTLFGEFDGPNAERVNGFLEFLGFTGELGAGSGDPFGSPGDPSVSGSFYGALVADYDLDASEYAVFLSDPVRTRLISFFDVTIDGPNGAPGIIFVETDLLSVTGSITLTYHYADVPAPAGAALLALTGLTAARRRRA